LGHVKRQCEGGEGGTQRHVQEVLARLTGSLLVS